MDWQDLFSSIILDRGYDYYIDDHVVNIKKTNDGYEAIVSGTDDYTVRIRIPEEKTGLQSCWKTCGSAIQIARQCKMN